MDNTSVHSWLRTAHIAAGFVGLAVFWLPLLVRKGGKLHVLAGRVFVICALVVLSSALVACAWRFIEPIDLLPPEAHPPVDQAAEFVRTLRLLFAFLAGLAIYTLVPLILAVYVVRTRHDPSQLGGSGPRFMIWVEVVASVALIAYAAMVWLEAPGMMLCLIPLVTGIVGLGSAWWDGRFLARPRTNSMYWWYKHMEFMLRTGIAFHTAFAVFVLTPYFGSLGSGGWALVPWVAPSVFGLPAVWLWIRHYRRKFGDLPGPVGETA